MGWNGHQMFASKLPAYAPGSCVCPHAFQTTSRPRSVVPCSRDGINSLPATITRWLAIMRSLNQSCIQITCARSLVPPPPPYQGAPATSDPSNPSRPDLEHLGRDSWQLSLATSAPGYPTSAIRCQTPRIARYARATSMKANDHP